jgi:hypothetical protein
MKMLSREELEWALFYHVDHRGDVNLDERDKILTHDQEQRDLIAELLKAAEAMDEVLEDQVGKGDYASLFERAHRALEND